MSRHVVLLRRDPSLGLALRALLYGTGRVTELQSVQAWSALPAEAIDAVVVDLPTSQRRQAIDLVRSRFNGRLVVVLDPTDDPAAVPGHHACSVVQRPFEIVELWHLVTTDRAAARAEPGPVGPGRRDPAPSRPPDPPAPRASEPTTLGTPEGPGRQAPTTAGSRGSPGRQAAGAPGVPAGATAGLDPAARGPGDRDSGARGPEASTQGRPGTAGQEASAAAGQGRPPAADASWKWRGRRYGPATAIPPGPAGGGAGTGGEESGRPTGAAGTAPEAPVPASPDPATRPPSEGRRWGALPRRSAERQPAPRPSREPERPGQPGSAAPDRTDAAAARAADPGAAEPAGGLPVGLGPVPAPPRSPARAPGPRPGASPPAPAAGSSAARPALRPTRPPAQNRPAAPAGSGQAGASLEPASTRDPLRDQPAAPTTARSGSGSGSPAAGSGSGSAPGSSPGTLDPERPSLLRRLAGHLGGRRSATESEAPEAAGDVRSASVPSFEPAPAAPEGTQQAPPAPVWPAPSPKPPAPGDQRARPSSLPGSRPAARGGSQPAPPEAAPPLPSPPPAPAPAARATPSGPTAAPPPAPPSAAPTPAETPLQGAPPAAPTGPSATAAAPGASTGLPPASARPSRPAPPRPAARPTRPTEPPVQPGAEPPIQPGAEPPIQPGAEPPAGPATRDPAGTADRQRRPSRPAADPTPPVPDLEASVPPAADERPTTRPEAEVPAANRAPPPKDQPGPAREDQAQLDRPGQAQPDPETRTPQDPQDQVRPDRPDQAAAAVRPTLVEGPGRPEPDEAAPAAARLGAAAGAAPAPGVERVAVPDDPSDAAEAVADREEVPETAGAPAAGGEGDPASVQAATAAAAPVDQAASPARKRPDPGRRPARPARPGGLPPAPRPPSPSLPASPPTGGGPAGEGDAPRPQQPAARARPPVEVSPAERPTQPGAPAPGGREPEAAARTRPSVPPDAPEVLLAAAEVTDPAAGPTPGTPAGPPEPASPGSPFDRTLAGERPPDPRPRGRRARNLLRFTAPRRPESTERAAAASDTPAPLADFDRLTQSIESVTEALGGQPLEFYERDLPQIAAAETARRVRADVVVLLLDNGEGLMEVSGGVGLTPAERRLSVEYSRDVMRELFRAGVGLIEDTDRVRGALAGIPGSRAETLVMVPLVHERLGFGVLMAGRNRSQTGVPTEVFSDAEIEVLMGFADAAAASLRTAVLLRHLKGQLKALEEEG